MLDPGIARRREVDEGQMVVVLVVGYDHTTRDYLA